MPWISQVLKAIRRKAVKAAAEWAASAVSPRQTVRVVTTLAARQGRCASRVGFVSGVHTVPLCSEYVYHTHATADRSEGTHFLVENQDPFLVQKSGTIFWWKKARPIFWCKNQDPFLVEYQDPFLVKKSEPIFWWKIRTHVWWKIQDPFSVGNLWSLEYWGIWPARRKIMIVRKYPLIVGKL